MLRCMRVKWPIWYSAIDLLYCCSVVPYLVGIGLQVHFGVELVNVLYPLVVGAAVRTTPVCWTEVFTLAWLSQLSRILEESTGSLGVV